MKPCRIRGRAFCYRYNLNNDSDAYATRPRLAAHNQTLHLALSLSRSTFDGMPPGPFGHVVSQTVYYGPGNFEQGSGTFTVTAAISDPLAGLAQITFPETSAPGDTYPQHGVTQAIVSQPYAFEAGDTFSHIVTVTTTDRAGNVTTAPFRVVNDRTPPVVAITVPAVSGLARRRRPGRHPALRGAGQRKQR